MKLDHDFFLVSKLSEDQKKRGLHRKLKCFCRRNHVLTKKGPNIIHRSDADHSQIIEGDADEDHSQIIGGMRSNCWGNITPHPPRVSAHLVLTIALFRFYGHLQKF